MIFNKGATVIQQGKVWSFQTNGTGKNDQPVFRKREKEA